MTVPALDAEPELWPWLRGPMRAFWQAHAMRPQAFMGVAPLDGGAIELALMAEAVVADERAQWVKWIVIADHAYRATWQQLNPSTRT